MPGSSCLIALLVTIVAGDSYADPRIDSPPAMQAVANGLEEEGVAYQGHAFPGEEPAPCPPPDAPAGNGEELTVALLNPANRLKLHAGLDTLMVFSTKRPFPAGLPLLLLPDSPFGLDTNTFHLHARQSYVGAFFSGPDLGAFKTGAEILLFLQNDSLSTDDYGLLVYYAYGELKNDDWRFAAGLQQDVFNPVSPTVVYLTR